MPLRHSTPASPRRDHLGHERRPTAARARGDKRSLAMRRSSKPRRSRCWTTRPSKPASATTRLEPPPSTSTALAAGAAPRASSPLLADARRTAARGPPSPSVVSGASGTSSSTITLQRATVALDSSTRTRFFFVAGPSRFSSSSITSLHTSWILPAPSVITRSPGRACSSSQRARSSRRGDVGDVGVAGSRDRAHERLAGDAGDRLLAGGVDVADHDHVGVVERAREVGEQIAGARVAVRLERGDDAAAGEAARARPRAWRAPRPGGGRSRRRPVTPPTSPRTREAPRDALKCRERARVGRRTARPGSRPRASTPSAFIGVVHARHRQRDLAELVAAAPRDEPRDHAVVADIARAVVACALRP